MSAERYMTKKTLRRFRVYVLLLVATVNVFLVVPSARADMWGSAFASNVWLDLVDMMQRQMEGAILSTLKVAAIQMLNSQIGQLVGGGSLGQALFITDYEAFLRQSPLQNTRLYMNDFFTLSTRGKYAMANYVSMGDVPGRVAGGYAGYLVQQVRGAIENQTTPQYNLEEYTPSPEAMFAEGDIRAFNAFISNAANNPFGYNIVAQEAYRDRLNTETEIAKIKATASGFLPAEKGGKVITPAATIEAVVSDVKTLGNKVIAAAENPSELVSGVIAGMVNQTINNLIQRGIGKVQANIQREINNVNYQVAKTLQEVNQTVGPAGQFIRTVNQRTKVRVNPNTLPPI